MMFQLVWDVVWAVIAAVLFGATLASPDRSVTRTIALFWFCLSFNSSYQ